jgi:DNA-binding TFAR19-related protein (PDSD5 family)
VWNITAPQIDMDVENELISLLSQEISREIDDEILRQVTQNINSGNNNLDYFNRWMDIGNNRA